MKKTLAVLMLTAILVGFIIPVLVSAQVAIQPPEKCILRTKVRDRLLPGCKAQGSEVLYEQVYGTEENQVRGAMCCMMDTVLYTTDWLFMAVMIVVVILILVGAFTLITAGGSEEGVKKGRNYIVYALIGVAVAILARAFPYIIRSILGA